MTGPSTEFRRASDEARRAIRAALQAARLQQLAPTTGRFLAEYIEARRDLIAALDRLEETLPGMEQPA